MTAYEIISKKRDGIELSDEEIRFMVLGYTEGSIPDYQMSAFLMAVYFQGMSEQETQAITQTMLYSGEVLDLKDIPGVKVDKHSTGGVGDKVSIILAPIVAAAGVPVPMISGRGLGHTGGTLDKLESIPGFRVDYSIPEFRRKLEKVGTCLIGQTPTLAPADKKIYALRDVTATIQSIPLITASIMSKKLAEGIDALVLDVKTGRGAFMQKEEDAVRLARSLIDVGRQAGKPVIAYITNMDQPLGNKIGNWLEIVECINALQGDAPDDLMDLTHTLCGAMIYLGKKAATVEEGMKISQEMITSGKAWNKFLEIVEEQNGDRSFVEQPEKYPRAKYSAELTAKQSGYLTGMDALEFGLTAVTLGAGRQKAEDTIDPKAGIVLHRKIGDKTEAGETIAVLYSDKEAELKKAVDRLEKAVAVSHSPPDLTPLIRKKLDKDDLAD